jgi:hypothetical protein
MTPVIDLRRFARAGERTVLVRPDGRELRAAFSHVSTEWATAEVPHASVIASDHVRAALFRDGARLAVTFEVLEVHRGSSDDSAELTVVAAAVLGERPIRTPAVVGEGEALAIRVGQDDHVERIPVRIMDVASGGIGIEGPDAFAPGDGRPAPTAAPASAAGWWRRRRTTRSACGRSPRRSSARVRRDHVPGPDPTVARSGVRPRS